METAKTIDLKPSPWNPASRTTRGALTALRQSIEGHGILVPLLVTHDMVVADGNRRLACALDLGMEEVPVRLVEGGPAEAFREANAATRRLTGNETLAVYLLCPEALSRGSLIKLRAAEKAIGAVNLRRLRDEGGSFGTYAQAVTLVRYCGKAETTEHLTSALFWLTGKGQTYSARKAMERRTAPLALWGYVARNRALPKR